VVRLCQHTRTPAHPDPLPGLIPYRAAPGARPSLTYANAARAKRTIVRQPNAQLQARHCPSVTDQGGLRAEPGRVSPRGRGGHRLGLKGPVEGLAADAEQAGDLGHGVLAVRVQLAGVVDLPGGEAGLASSDPAAGAGGGQALVGAFDDELALELVEGASSL